MTTHCIHCPDYNPDNMYDLTAIHGKQVDDVKLAGKKANGTKTAKAIDDTFGKVTSCYSGDQDEYIVALKPTDELCTDELKTSESSDPCSISLLILFGSLLGAMAYSLLTEVNCEQIMKTQPSPRQFLMKALTTALMIRQVGAADDGLIVRSEQALSRSHAMISSSLCLKLLMTFTVIVIGILGTWSLTVKMVTCCRHVKKTLHEFHQSFIQWLRPIND